MELRIRGSDHGYALLQFDHWAWKSGYSGNHHFPIVAIKQIRPRSPLLGLIDAGLLVRKPHCGLTGAGNLLSHHLHHRIIECGDPLEIPSGVCRDTLAAGRFKSCVAMASSSRRDEPL
jgi:hypothetical protein